MSKLEECVRSVQMDGLLWGASKLMPVGYGIKKLQISCVVEDDKVGTDILEEEITKFEDFVSHSRAVPHRFIHKNHRLVRYMCTHAIWLWYTGRRVIRFLP